MEKTNIILNLGDIMDINKSLDKVFGRLGDIPLAILIDLLMLIPFIDFVITIPLQFYLWSRMGSDGLKYVNIIYDGLGDFIVPGIGDIFPLNTVCVIGMKISKRL